MNRIVWIEWVDSTVFHGWEEVSIFAESHPAVDIKHCRSIGFVVHESEKSITISSTVAGEPDQCCNAITIPKVAIVQIDEVAWQ